MPPRKPNSGRQRRGRRPALVILVQTRVPPVVHDYLVRAANAEGDTLAGYLRRLLMKLAAVAGAGPAQKG